MHHETGCRSYEPSPPQAEEGPAQSVVRLRGLPSRSSSDAQIQWSRSIHWQWQVCGAIDDERQSQSRPRRDLDRLVKPSQLYLRSGSSIRDCIARHPGTWRSINS